MYGGNSIDEAFCSAPTKDNGFIVAGRTNSFAFYDLWVTKIDSAGNIVWEKAYGQSGSEVANSIIETADGFVLTGSTSSFGAGTYDLWVLKLDPSGNVIWQRAYGTSQPEEGYSIHQTNDGGYIVAGYIGMSNEAWILKLDGNGNIVWQRSYSINNDSFAFSITTSSDNGYVFAGQYNSQYLWVVKLDQNGNFVWQKKYVQGNWGDKAKSIIPTADNGFLVTGTKDTSSMGRWYDVWVLKLDSSGNLQWERTFGNQNTTDIGESAFSTSDGSFIIGGVTDQLITGTYEPFILKLDPQGNMLWQKFYGLGNLWSIQPTVDGGIHFAGMGIPGPEFWVAKTDANGDLGGNCSPAEPGIFELVNLNSVTSDTVATFEDTTATIFDTSANVIDTAATTSADCSNPCLFCDEFDDGILDPSWTYASGSWLENSGSLSGVASKKALTIASPVFGGCSNCSIETALLATGGPGKVVFLAWYQDKQNTLELVMDEAKDKWRLKRKINGTIVNKLGAKRQINPNQSYYILMMFDGTSFKVFIDGELLFEILNTFSTPSGTVGLKVKSMTGSMDYVHVN